MREVDLVIEPGTGGEVALLDRRVSATASWKYSGTGLAGSSVLLSRMISTTSFGCVSAR
jgi:hypothetical protein